MNERYRQTRHLTGLRAYAALYVFLIHSGGLGLRDLGPFANRVVDDGKYGVVVFFVLSALTLSMSIQREAKFSYGTFLIRRFLRIAPLYYVVCAICLAWPATYYLKMFGVEADLENLLWHVSFLNLFNLPYLNSLVGVEWTIPIEMFFYLLIPGAAYLARSRRGAVLLLAIAVGLYFTRDAYIAWVADGEVQRSLAKDLSPQRYIVCFLTGIYAFELMQQKGERLRAFQSGPAFLVVVGLWILHLNVKLGSQVPVYTFLTVGLMLTSGGANRVSQWLFSNRVAYYLGTISYSLYLVHLPILRGFRAGLGDSDGVAWLALATVVAVASLTYFAIEKPFLALSSRLRKRRAAGAATGR